MLIIELVNKKQVGQVADYYFRVKVNAEVIAEGWVCNHNRLDGWQSLVGKFAEIVKQDADTEMAIALSELANMPCAGKVS